MPEEIELTEEIFDAIVTPIAVAAVLQGLASTVRDVGPPDTDFFTGLERWPSEIRAGAIGTIREDALELRNWAQGVLDLISQIEEPDA